MSIATYIRDYKTDIPKRMEQEIKKMIEEALPLVDADSEFLFGELDSLGIAEIMMMLGDKYGVTLDYSDVTPKNFKSVKSLAELVMSKKK